MATAHHAGLLVVHTESCHALALNVERRYFAAQQDAHAGINAVV